MTLSVIIPAYNRASVIPAAIRSVFSQGFGDLEVIVVDDASSDGTREAVAALKDPRLVYIRHERNQGGAAARNTGITAARGEYVAFLDSDDEWLPGKLQKQMDLFKKLDDAYGVVYTGLKVEFEDGRPGEISPAVHRGYFLNELLVSNCVRTLSSVIVKRKYLQDVGGLDARLRSCQDWDLYIRLMKVCKFECVQEPLVVYYVNKQDPSRISNAGKSIIQGHDMILQKFQEDYRQLPAADLVRHLESVSEMYSLGGSLARPVSMMGKAFMLTGQPRYITKGARYFARYFRNRLRNKKAGY
jgi:glycosyltransferase involved in cell wall biosynthesis